MVTDTAPDLELVSKGQVMPRTTHHNPTDRPTDRPEDQVIYITGPGASVGFSTLVSDCPRTCICCQADKRSPDTPTDGMNQVISMTGPGWKGPFSTLISDIPPDIQFMGNGQAFPRYTYPKETSR